MKIIYKIILVLPFLISLTTYGQLGIEDIEPNLPIPSINQERGYRIVSLSPETFVPRGDINNWIVNGGTIVNFNTDTDAVVVQWTTAGTGYLQYTGLQEWESGTENDPTPQTFQKIEITSKNVTVVDPNDVSSYFDASVVYTSCYTAYLSTRTDIPDTEEWYWQFTATGQSKELKVYSTLDSGTNTGTEGSIGISVSGSYYIRSYTSASNSWSAAKQVTVDFSNVPAYVTKTTWYADTDQDGFGDPNSTPIISCTPPSGYVNNSLDICPNEAGENKGCATSNYLNPILSNNENYIYTAIPQVAVKNIIDIQKQKDVIEGVNYYDGLGRIIKSIAIGQSPTGKDVIKVNIYDQMGRQQRQYLPFTSTTNGGSFNPTTNPDRTNQFEITKFYENYLSANGESQIYSNVIPYSQTSYDNTPYNIPLKQAAPGKDWKMGSGHEMTFDQDFNQENEVRKYKVTYTANNLTTSTLVEDGFYPYKMLEKSIIKNEHGVKTETYVNKQGQTVLTRKASLDTYNIYDDYGNLSFVLSPKVNITDGISPDELSELGYQYIYSASGRVIEKKDPGKGWEQIVYNYLGQPVLVQSAKLEIENKWIFTKYDYFGRAIYTGIYIDSRSRSEIQIEVDNLPKDALYETKTDNPLAGFQGQLYYTNTIFPTAITELHTISYYDNYVFDRTANPLAIAPTQVYARNITENTQDFTTGSKTKILGTEQWITSVVYYDTDGTPIYTFAHNPYLETVDVVKLKLDFSGKVLKSRSYHKKGTNTEIVTQQLFTYDHSGRLLDEKQCIGDNSLPESCGNFVPLTLQLYSPVYEAKEAIATQSIIMSDGFVMKATATNSLVANIQAVSSTPENVEVISSNQYDELGQLALQKVGNTKENPLQNINYTYNIRGWLKGINDIEILSNDHFSFKISYQKNELEIHNGSTIGGLYNGNISETQWKTATDNQKYGYAYTYDDYDRLSNSLYFINGNNHSSFNEYVTYDKNGNITTLHRYNHNNTTVDFLDYTMDDGNKLLKVSDLIGNPEGFKDGINTGDDYTYDIDGNMTGDHNKGITNIIYNHLDLPVRIEGGSSGIYTSYIYDANGTKLEKITIQGSATIKTQYAGNYVYTGSGLGSQVSADNLQFFSHSEGYIEVDGQGEFMYVYQYRDHLGNIRLSYADKDGDGKIDIERGDVDIDGDGDLAMEIREEKHYYAFGLQHDYGTNDPRMMVRGRKHNYGFNRIEYNEDLGANFYEMPLRSYDPVIARWTTQDPVVHHMYSPYSAFDNNPVYWADPSGANSEYSSAQDYFGGFLQEGNDRYNPFWGVFSNYAQHETERLNHIEQIEYQNADYGPKLPIEQAISIYLLRNPKYIIEVGNLLQEKFDKIGPKNHPNFFKIINNLPNLLLDSKLKKLILDYSEIPEKDLLKVLSPETTPITFFAIIGGMAAEKHNTDGLGMGEIGFDLDVLKEFKNLPSNENERLGKLLSGSLLAIHGIAHYGDEFYNNNRRHLARLNTNLGHLGDSINKELCNCQDYNSDYVNYITKTRNRYNLYRYRIFGLFFD